MTTDNYSCIIVNKYTNRSSLLKWSYYVKLCSNRQIILLKSLFRLLCCEALFEKFVEEYFYLNPISQEHFSDLMNRTWKAASYWGVSDYDLWSIRYFCRLGQIFTGLLSKSPMNLTTGIYILVISPFVQIEKQGKIWRRTSWKKGRKKRGKEEKRKEW